MKKNASVLRSLYATLIAVVLVILLNFIQKGKYSIGEIVLFGINFFILYTILVYLFRKLGYKL